MAIDHQTWTFVFGLLGNIISFLVFLAPLPTFYKIYKKKSTEGFQCLPYAVGLFSAMLWIYYALCKKDTTLLITINLVGCFIESTYIILFIFYAPRKTRMQSLKVVTLLNVVGYGLMLVLTFFLSKGAKRIKVIGWICLVFNVSVFAAPLCIIRQVVRTKSVEFMPLLLSFSLTLSAVMWFFYGLFLKDYYIAFPNTLGFLFGIVQMVLYSVYKNAKKVIAIGSENQPKKIQELSEHIIDVVKLGTVGCTELIPTVVFHPSDIISTEAIVDPTMELEQKQEIASKETKP